MRLQQKRNPSFLTDERRFARTRGHPRTAAAFDMGRDARTGRLDAEQKRRLARIFAAARALREDEVGRR